MKPSTEAQGDAGLPLFDQAQYIALIDSLYPRFLNQIDRDPDSPTFGSCDRGYWMCRLHDFDSGVLQQAPLALAGLAAMKHSFQSQPLRFLSSDDSAYWPELARAVSMRTARLLTSNGYLDEYYPGEQSLPGTVFAAYATLKSASMLGQSDVLDHPGLRKTAEQLIRRTPSPAANQDTAAAAFLALYAKLHDWRVDQSAETVSRLLAGIPGRPAFSEYGGGDLGYASVSLNYLAHMRDDQSFDTAEEIRTLASFIADFVSPRGTLGGEYASRSTTYFLPFGLIAASRLAPELAPILGSLDPRACYDRLDDRYIMHYAMPSLSVAARHLCEDGPPDVLPEDQAPAPRCADHSDRGLVALHVGDNAAFVGINKGGAYQVETSERTVIDCGYRLERSSRVFATCVVDDEADHVVDISNENITIQITARFLSYRTLIASPLKTIVLRLLAKFGPYLSGYFKKRLIQAPLELTGTTLDRRLHMDFQTGRMVVEDTLTGVRPGDKVTISPPISPRLVPSARFFQNGEVDAFRQGEPLNGTTRRVELELPRMLGKPSP